MKQDEFSFFNQQLAGMLRGGIPLEGALKQLCSSIERGELRTEMEGLQADLARGTPLREAVGRRKLPELYRELVAVGAQGNDLPGLLTLLADYYRRSHSISTRLKALMVYPAIVVGAALALSLLLMRLYTVYAESAGSLFGELYEGMAMPGITRLSQNYALIFPAMWLTVLAAVFVVLVGLPAARRWARWRVPGFREATLAQFASTIRLLLTAGTPLPKALKLLEQLERDTPAGKELAAWHDRLGSGAGRPSDFADPGGVFPPLFLWLVAEGGEDLAGGFARAAEIYGERARHRVEMMLYAALPVAVLGLGFLVMCQLALMLRVLGLFVGLSALGGEGGMFE
jgi:type II secretory pathway component PulF